MCGASVAVSCRGMKSELGVQEGRTFLGSVKGNVGHLNTAAGVERLMSFCLLNQMCCLELVPRA